MDRDGIDDMSKFPMRCVLFRAILRSYLSGADLETLDELDGASDQTIDLNFAHQTPASFRIYQSRSRHDFSIALSVPQR